MEKIRSLRIPENNFQYWNLCSVLNLLQLEQSNVPISSNILPACMHAAVESGWRPAPRRAAPHSGESCTPPPAAASIRTWQTEIDRPPPAQKRTQGRVRACRTSEVPSRRWRRWLPENPAGRRRRNVAGERGDGVWLYNLNLLRGFSEKIDVLLPSY